MLRLFIAVELPQQVKDALGQLIAPVGRRVRGVRWVDPEAVHLTLKFLGDVPAEQTGAIATEMTLVALGMAPFQMVLQGVGGFPNLQRPRVLWVGLAGDLAAATALQRALEEALLPLGYPAEARPFSPHLTLGRVRDTIPPVERQRIGEALARAPLPPARPVPVDAVSLIQSTLTPQGARYTRLHLAPLVGGSR